MPVVFREVFGEQGHAVRATVSDLGPLLLGRILNLNETQQGVPPPALALAPGVMDNAASGAGSSRRHPLASIHPGRE